MLHKLQIALILALALLFSSPSSAEARGEKAEGSIENISVKDAEKLIKSKGSGIVIVDVRTPGEFKQGHIAGAENMDLFGTKFEDQVARLPRDKPVLLYCRTGNRSAGAADLLKEAGLKVLHMNEGIQGWEKARLPVARN